MTAPDYALYGSELSLYTGKARCTLRKKGVRFETRSTSHPGFARAVEAVGRPVQPILETADGEFVSDTTRIIDFLEARHPEPSLYPAGPCQRLAALLLELYGDEGLLKPAMHYRWSFPDENDAFLASEFGRAISQLEVPAPPGLDAGAAGAARWKLLSRAMREGIVPALGVTAASIPAIEEATLDLLARLDAHFGVHPYLLGGRPSVGDLGLAGPLHAHLGRDPRPSGLLKERAPLLVRWVERMTVADPGTTEFPGAVQDFLPDDEVPETLLPVLELMARDFLPELLGIFARVDAWLGEHPEVGPGDAVPGTSAAMGTAGPFGTHTVVLRDAEIELAVRHGSIWMAQRPIDHFAALAGAERARAEALLEATGLRPLFDLSPRLRIGLRGAAEVFA